LTATYGCLSAKLSEPAAEAFRALDDLKQAITDLMGQRDSWIKRYEDAMHDMAEAKAERDYWQLMSYEMEE
jgi:hypothetical protein